MSYYYVALESRSHAFLLQRRMELEQVESEITYMPRTMMTSLCTMGVRFKETELHKAVAVIRRSGLPGCRLYKEIIHPNDSLYVEEEL